MFSLQPPRHISTLPNSTDLGRPHEVRFAPDRRHESGREVSLRLRQITFPRHAHMRLGVALDLILKFTVGIFRQSPDDFIGAARRVRTSADSNDIANFEFM